MKLMTCPINGVRPISEFVYGGEFRPMPEPQTCSDAAWADYVFNRNGAAGVKVEWWCHAHPPPGSWSSAIPRAT
jgi:sarcosine oxidase subunit delta